MEVWEHLQCLLLWRMSLALVVCFVGKRGKVDWQLMPVSTICCCSRRPYHLWYTGFERTTAGVCVSRRVDVLSLCYKYGSENAVLSCLVLVLLWVLLSPVLVTLWMSSTLTCCRRMGVLHSSKPSRLCQSCVYNERSCRRRQPVTWLRNAVVVLSDAVTKTLHCI